MSGINYFSASFVASPEGVVAVGLPLGLDILDCLGVLLTFDKLVNTSAESSLAFRPLTPMLENRMYLVWKKYQVFSPIAERFLSTLREESAE